MRHRPIHGWMRRQGWQPPTHRHRDTPTQGQAQTNTLIDWKRDSEEPLSNINRLLCLSDKKSASIDVFFSCKNQNRTDKKRKTYHMGPDDINLDSLSSPSDVGKMSLKSKSEYEKKITRMKKKKFAQQTKRAQWDLASIRKTGGILFSFLFFLFFLSIKVLLSSFRGPNQTIQRV